MVRAVLDANVYVSAAIRPDGPCGLILESWKEIAAYLKRDVRTVQRWERRDGLPIHRHQRMHRPIPYAYKSELDAWWTRRSGGTLPAADPEERTARARAISWLRYWWILLMFGLGVFGPA